MLTTVLACGLGASLLGSGYALTKSRLYKQEGLKLWNKEKLASESVIDTSSYEKCRDSYRPGQHYMIGFPATPYKSIGNNESAYLIDIYEKYVYQKIHRTTQPQVVPSWDIGRWADFAFADGDFSEAIRPNLHFQFQEQVSVGTPKIVWNNSPKYSLFVHPEFQRLGVTCSRSLDLSTLSRQSLELKEEVISLGKDMSSELKSIYNSVPVTLIADDVYKRDVRLVNSQSIYIWARYYPTGAKADMLDTDPVVLAQRVFETERIENETARSWANFGIAMGVMATVGCTIGLVCK